MKKIFVGLLLALTITWMGIVFCLSAENATESKKNSVAVMEKIAKTFKINIENRAIFEDKLRTFAHFSLYLCGGFIFYLLVILAKLPYKHKIMCCSSFGFVYASIDEIHQILVPGRSFEIKDIITDFCGFLIGTIIMFLICKLKNKFFYKEDA